MTATTKRIASRFLAIGGRFIIKPNGEPDFGIDFGPLLSLKTPDRERRHRLRLTRAARKLVDERGADLADMVRQSGATTGAWIVWEGQ